MENVVTKKGVMSEGKCIITCKFDNVVPAIVDGKDSDILYITVDDDLSGLAKYIPEKDDVIYTKNEYNSISTFVDGIAIVAVYDERHGKKFGLINSDFEDVLNCNFDSITRLSNNLYSVKREGKYGIFDTDLEKIVVKCEFNGISYEKNKVDSHNYSESIIIEI